MKFYFSLAVVVAFFLGVGAGTWVHPKAATPLPEATQRFEAASLAVTRERVAQRMTRASAFGPHERTDTDGRGWTRTEIRFPEHYARLDLDGPSGNLPLTSITFHADDDGKAFGILGFLLHVIYPTDTTQVSDTVVNAIRSAAPDTHSVVDAGYRITISKYPRYYAVSIRPSDSETDAVNYQMVAAQFRGDDD